MISFERLKIFEGVVYMKLEIVYKIRTNNFNDPHVMQKITNMWKVASQKLSHHEGITYGLYYEYASDYKGDYSLGVAIEGENESAIMMPHGIKYEVFKVNTEEEQGIFNTWNDIWNKEEEGLLKRAYTYDYEKYYPDGDIEIFIAIKEK